MEVMLPIQPMDFDFSSAMSTPFSSPPSTPRRFGDHFYSAPTSPSHLSQFYHDFNDFSKQEDDFEFDLGDQSHRISLTADELFDGGKIRPLKLPSPNNNTQLRSQSKKKKETENTHIKSDQERGRPRAISDPSSSNSSRRGTRSLSPYRTEQTSETPKPLLSVSSSKGLRKWKLSDLFLFRSASEGRASERDPLKKYTASFRSSEGSNCGSKSKRRGPAVSAHELHYTANRAVSEDLKRKTFLPYKRGILGSLPFWR